MNLTYSGKTALITGGARGIGYATANILALGGASIALADINGDLVEESAKRLAKETGQKIIGVKVDVTSESQVRDMVDVVRQRLGPTSIFISSAAIVDDRLFVETSPKDWRTMLDVCLYGPMLCLYEIIPDMKRQGYGRVICLASDSARTGQARLSTYAAAKAGVIGLVKSLAQELGGAGINLNVVSPGATNTELRQDREAKLRIQMGEEKYQRRVANVLKLYPLGRLGEPSDVAAAVAFLASGEAAWITGQVLSVNGGYAMF